MNFREDFLQLVWKYQYFDRKDLLTTSGEKLEIVKVGFHNPVEGPDFRDAGIVINGIGLFGHVEVHRSASEWKQHAHERDAAYDSVVLHVVWEEDKQVYRSDGTTIPTLELKGRIYLEVWRKYEQLLDYKSDLPCAHALSGVPSIVRFSALEKALVSRLQEKTESVLEMLQEAQGDWEETAYQWLFWSFGFKSNSLPMLELARKVPYKTLQRYRERPNALEAILFGQAGLLPSESDDQYVKLLIQEYGFYSKKHDWGATLLRQHWTFMGVRPNNFPTLRIAQLAAMLSSAPSLLEAVIENPKGLSSFKRLLRVKPGLYWQDHYSFAQRSSKRVSKGISQSALELILLNYVIPLWFAYGKYFQEESWQERCFELLQEIPGENNFIIRKFHSSGWTASSAFDSQGMIGLFKNFCKPKNCLRCKIAQNLIKS